MTVSWNVHHNFFDRVGYRNPRVSYGKVHAYDNYLLAWETHGMSSVRTGQLFAEANIFEAEPRLNATVFAVTADGTRRDGAAKDERAGYLKATGNLALNGAKVLENDPGYAFKASDYYRDTVERPTSPAAWDALMRSVRYGAGPRTSTVAVLGDSISKGRRQPSPAKRPHPRRLRSEDRRSPVPE